MFFYKLQTRFVASYIEGSIHAYAGSCCSTVLYISNVYVKLYVYATVLVAPGFDWDYICSCPFVLSCFVYEFISYAHQQFSACISLVYIHGK